MDVLLLARDVIGAQIEPHPPENRGVSPPVLFEADVRVDFDDNVRLGWRVVDGLRR